MSAAAKKQSASRAGTECCEALALVLDHTHSVDKKVGIQREMFWHFKDGSTSHRLVVHFPKLTAKQETAFPEYRKAAWAELNYCPFCGKQIRKPKE